MVKTQQTTALIYDKCKSHALLVFYIWMLVTGEANFAPDNTIVEKVSREAKDLIFLKQLPFFHSIIWLNQFKFFIFYRRNRFDLLQS